MKRILLAMAAAMALLFAAPFATGQAKAGEGVHGRPAVSTSVAERAAVTAEYARWRRHYHYRRHFYRPRYHYHRRYYRPRYFYRPYRHHRHYGYRRYYW